MIRKIITVSVDQFDADEAAEIISERLSEEGILSEVTINE